VDKPASLSSSQSESIDINAHNAKWGTLFGTAVDLKNIDLAKIVYGLRQDLDIHCVLSLNGNEIDRRTTARLFFHQIHHRAINSIVLDICKIYEREGRYELNSIDGVIRYLRDTALPCRNESVIREFIQKYCAPSIGDLDSAVEHFRDKHEVDLERFKKARDKSLRTLNTP
jgi:hypothetical protein